MNAKSRLMPLTDEREEERDRSELSGVQYTKSRGCLERLCPDEWDDERLREPPSSLPSVPIDD